MYGQLAFTVQLLMNHGLDRKLPNFGRKGKAERWDPRMKDTYVALTPTTGSGRQVGVQRHALHTIYTARAMP